MLDEMAAQIRAELSADGIADGRDHRQFEIDVRYAGQAFEVPMTIDAETLGATGSPASPTASTTSIAACSPSTWTASTSS